MRKFQQKLNNNISNITCMLHNITDTPDCSQYSHFWFTLCPNDVLQELLTLSSLDYVLGEKGEMVVIQSTASKYILSNS